MKVPLSEMKLRAEVARLQQENAHLKEKLAAALKHNPETTSVVKGGILSRMTEEKFEVVDVEEEPDADLR